MNQKPAPQPELVMAFRHASLEAQARFLQSLPHVDDPRTADPKIIMQGHDEMIRRFTAQDMAAFLAIAGKDEGLRPLAGKTFPILNAWSGIKPDRRASYEWRDNMQHGFEIVLAKKLGGKKLEGMEVVGEEICEDFREGRISLPDLAHAIESIELIMPPNFMEEAELAEIVMPEKFKERPEYETYKALLKMKEALREASDGTLRRYIEAHAPAPATA